MLRDLGNTVIVVEHDRETMEQADYIVDFGPGAGEHGGAIVAQGTVHDIQQNKHSLTGKYLTGERKIARPRAQNAVNLGSLSRESDSLTLVDASHNNLKHVNVSFPLGKLICITGVSGSGKSTLVHEVIFKSLEALHKADAAAGDDPSKGAGASASEPAAESLETGPRLACRKVEGADRITTAVMVDQSPIGRTPRSNPVTYLKAFDIVRGLFASTREAEKRGYTAGHFSFNVPGGRCETCQGDGTVTVEMQFLADVELICDECKGTRYKSGILEITYNGLNIHQVLQLTVREAMDFFHATPRLVQKLKVLDDVGLGYLRLGQSATTLSGGEAQRVKLAAHLASASCAGTLFIFDEPTTGLHFDDIAKLLASFERLIANGGSLVIIEHNLEVIRAADWVIDLGPEGGFRGGQVVAAGTPEDVARVAESHTGRFLRDAL